MSGPVDPNGPWQQPPYGGPPPTWQPPVPTAAPPAWQQPGDYLPYPPPPPPPPRRHTRLIIAIAVAGVLVVVAVVAAVVNELLAGAVPNARPFDAGSHGGVLRCGSATFGAASETMCAWSDSHTVGMLVSISPARPPQELAQVANQFRDKLD